MKNKRLKEIIVEVDAELNSGTDLELNLLGYTVFRDILKRWIKLVDRNIKYLEEKLAQSGTRSET